MEVERYRRLSINLQYKDNNMNEQYDFAFSFAGEDRILVEKIKDGLNGFKIFYDEDKQSELCGKDLYNYLRNLYMKRTKYVVCFLSKHYKKKVWTNLEFSAIKERLMSTFFASDFLIPIILEEDALLEDIPAYMGFYKHKSVHETVDLLKKKYEQSLNEDFYLENVSHFSEYLLQEILYRLKSKGIQAKRDKNTLVINSEPKRFYLLPEDFSNLPCLLLYEGVKENPPVGIITWKRSKNLLFTWNSFTDLLLDDTVDISIDELIPIIEEYFLRSESER